MLSRTCFINLYIYFLTRVLYTATCFCGLDFYAGLCRSARMCGKSAKRLEAMFFFFFILNFLCEYFIEFSSQMWDLSGFKLDS